MWITVRSHFDFEAYVADQGERLKENRSAVQKAFIDNTRAIIYIERWVAV